MNQQEHHTIQLPEPDHHGDGFNTHGEDTITSQWEITALRDVHGVVTAWTNGIEVEGQFYDATDDGEHELIAQMEDDALKLLAAIHEHRRCRSREDLEDRVTGQLRSLHETWAAQAAPVGTDMDTWCREQARTVLAALDQPAASS